MHLISCVITASGHRVAPHSKDACLRYLERDLQLLQYSDLFLIPTISPQLEERGL
jgi:hypothetical protein